MSIIEKWMKDPQFVREVAQETLILDVTEELLREMHGLDISRVQLAQKLGKPKSQISQLFSGSRNMTLRTLADICWALGLKPRVTFALEQAGAQIGSISGISHASKNQEFRYGFERARVPEFIPQNSELAA